MQYARIVNGNVVELITLTASQDITKMFNPALVWVEVPTTQVGQVAQGWQYLNGSFTAPPAPPPLTLTQQAQIALAAGVKIESTSTPALNGTYACAGPLFDDMVQEISAIAAGIGLIGGGSTMPWVDQNGVQHTVTQAQFLAIAGAVRNYVAACKQVIAGVSGASIPAQTVTIP